MSAAEREPIRLDGSYGEGGGQILRTALSLSVALRRGVRLENIRAKRPKPGLRPQHLMAVRAAAQISGAVVEGDSIGSRELLFVPQHPPAIGAYTFDVGATEAGGSAGAVSLVFQTVFLPLSLADAPSDVTLIGGTHVPWSPPFHYLAHVFLPSVAPLGLRAHLQLEQWGWYPKGGGIVRARIWPRQASPAAEAWGETGSRRGRVLRVWGISAASNLPEHVIERQAAQAREALRKAGLRAEIEETAAPASGIGTVVFLAAEYENGIGGFTAYGALRKPAEKVADEAVRDLAKFHASKTMVDVHLADQMLLPIVMCGAEASFTTPTTTAHLTTNAWAIEQFLGPLVQIEPHERGALITVRHADLPQRIRPAGEQHV
jgi:RNA 3'-terminal phosphate cyclase (ATP)